MGILSILYFIATTYLESATFKLNDRSIYLENSREVGRITVRNGVRAGFYDSLSVLIHGFDQSSVLFGKNVDNFSLQITDFEGTVFSDTLLPTNANFSELDLQEFDLKQYGGLGSPVLQLKQTTLPYFSYTVIPLDPLKAARPEYSDAVQRTPFTLTTIDNPANNTAPIAVDDFADTEINFGAEFSIDELLLNDRDSNKDRLTLTKISNFVNGTVRIFRDKVVFDPSPDFTGKASFDYTIDDGNGGTDTATVTIAVDPAEPINPPLAAQNDSFATEQDTPLTIPIIDLLVNDIDAGANTLSLGLIANIANGSVKRKGANVIFTPQAEFFGEAGFDYTVRDSKGAIDRARVAIAVNRFDLGFNLPPTATDDRFAIQGNAPFTISSALLLSNDSDGNGDNLTLENVGNAINGSVKLNGTQVTFVPTPDANLTNYASFNYTISDGRGGTDTATVEFAVSPDETVESTIQQYDGNWFGINGTGSQTLKLTLTDQQTDGINELGMFQVDDTSGKINGIAPGEPGYAAAAIARSRVVMSALSDFSNTLFPGLETTRHLVVDGGSYWGFYLASNSTTDTIESAIASGQIPSNLAFGFPSAGRLLVEEGEQGSFTLNFDDGLGAKDFNDFQVTLTLNDDRGPIGTTLQDLHQGELIDLRNQAGFQAATFSNFSDASYRNELGLYTVDSEAGDIGSLAPGDAGYAAAALERRVDLTTGLEGGKLFAPFLVANGTVSEFLSQNPTNQANADVRAYFAYIGANPDKVDHVRLLGNNTFAFEDLFGGGDLDYNDAVIQVDFA